MEKDLEKEDLCVSYLSDDFTHILDHHLICCYRLHSEQAPLMNVTWTETSHFLTELLFGNRRKKVFEMQNSNFSCIPKQKK